MKRFLLILSCLFLGHTLHAETLESYLFLSNITQLEQQIVAFSRYDILAQHYPNHLQYPLLRRQSLKQYEALLNASINYLKHDERRSLMTHFLEAKNVMKGLVAPVHMPKESQRLRQSSRILAKEVAAVSQKNIPALSPQQRVEFALTQTGMLLEILARDYVLAADPTGEEKDTAAIRDRMIGQIDHNLLLCKRYQYWGSRELDAGDKIYLSWRVLKKNLMHAEHRPLVISLGAEYIGSLIRELLSLHREEE